MAYALAIRLKWEPVRSLAFGSIVAGYTAIGTPLSNPARQIFIQNLTDATLMFSFDGINDHFPLPGNGFLLDDITSNQTKQEGFYISAQTTLYVKRIGIPSLGSVYFSSAYGSNAGN